MNVELNRKLSCGSKRDGGKPVELPQHQSHGESSDVVKVPRGEKRKRVKKEDI